MTERRSTDTYVKRRVRLLAIAWCFLALGIVGGLVRADQLVGRIDDLTMRLHDAGCANTATLRRVIAKQPPPNRPFYRRLGFTDAQIDVIADAVEQSKAANLDLLGPRDPTCPPPKEP